ncbi:hypothetical protein [Streptomyces sp. NPDC002788]
MTDRPALTPQLGRTRVMAILRSADASGLPAAARALASGGITCLEITLTTRDALAGTRAAVSTPPPGAPP